MPDIFSVNATLSALSLAVCDKTWVTRNQSLRFLTRPRFLFRESYRGRHAACHRRPFWNSSFRELFLYLKNKKIRDVISNHEVYKKYDMDKLEKSSSVVPSFGSILDQVWKGSKFLEKSGVKNWHILVLKSVRFGQFLASEAQNLILEVSGRSFLSNF